MTILGLLSTCLCSTLFTCVSKSPRFQGPQGQGWGTFTSFPSVQSRAGKGQAPRQHWLSRVHLLSLSDSQLSLLPTVCLSVCLLLSPSLSPWIGRPHCSNRDIKAGLQWGAKYLSLSPFLGGKYTLEDSRVRGRAGVCSKQES